MNPAETNKYFAKRDVLLLAVLMFCVVSLLVMYEAFQMSKKDTQDVTVDVPPVVIDKLDLTVFERLKTMTN